MLKDYLSVAQDALRTQKELYHVKEQRLALALDEYVRLNDAYKEKSSSRTSRSSSSTKYDPDILKAEISTTRLRRSSSQDNGETTKGEEAYKFRVYLPPVTLFSHLLLKESGAPGLRSGKERCPILLTSMVKKLKRELSQMKQELLYKEQGFETLQQ
ncbi:hypothetical protein U0070_023291 [Myodes glareolus]|uniref:Uncharacterized protein n=1 Tax=Myodes glareolus TaxID=447135 RepID=A0AAW0IDA5_MYOGA